MPIKWLRKGDEQMYTIYALVDPRDYIARYIGMSTNVHQRLARHLSCTGTNERKDNWIRELLANDKVPVLREIEQVEDVERARAREQHWIRYCLGRSVDLVNIAITMTDKEREEVHRERAALYTRISLALASGIYVKRCGIWYPPRLLAPYTRNGLDIPLTQCIFVTSDGRRVLMIDSSDQEFDEFIRQCIAVDECETEAWDFHDRYDVIKFARAHGKSVAILREHSYPVKMVYMGRRSRY